MLAVGMNATVLPLKSFSKSFNILATYSKDDAKNNFLTHICVIIFSDIV